MPNNRYSLALTSAELRVLQVLANGMSPQEGCRQLCITRNTFKGYLAVATRKLGARSTNQAIAKAVNQGLIEISDLLESP